MHAYGLNQALASMHLISRNHFHADNCKCVCTPLRLQITNHVNQT